MKKKDDLRVIKTKRSIHNSFILLLQKKSFSAITVQDILDEALINRTTFYKYYDSKYHLAEIMCEEVLEKFQDMLEFSLTNRKDVKRLFDNIERVAESFYIDGMRYLHFGK